MKKFDTLFESRRNRALLFIGALITALVFADILNQCEFPSVFFYFPIYPLFFFVGPYTLFGLIPVGWIVYIVIILRGVLKGSKELFKIFAILLLLSLLVPILYIFGVGSLPC